MVGLVMGSVVIVNGEGCRWRIYDGAGAWVRWGGRSDGDVWMAVCGGNEYYDGEKS